MFRHSPTGNLAPAARAIKKSPKPRKLTVSLSIQPISVRAGGLSRANGSNLALQPLQSVDSGAHDLAIGLVLRHQPSASRSAPQKRHSIRDNVRPGRPKVNPSTFHVEQSVISQAE